jgi:hypothetical protein
MQQVITYTPLKQQLEELQAELELHVPRFTLTESDEIKRKPWNWLIQLPWSQNWWVYDKRLLPDGRKPLVLALYGSTHWMVLHRLSSSQVLWTCSVSAQPRYLVCGPATLALLLGRLRALDTPPLSEPSRAALRRFVDEGAQL